MGNNFGVFLSLTHVILPELVNVLELLRLSLKLSLDVLSVEDVLEVHPLTLEGSPLTNYIINGAEASLPFVGSDLLSDLFDVSGAKNALDNHDVVFQFSDDFLDLFDDKAVL